jgi:lathosterol oxidase
MDLVLDVVDHYVLTPYVYGTNWPTDDPLRQVLSLLLITNIGGYILYFLLATISFYTIFDQRLLQHPQILPVSWYLAMAFF